MSRLPRPLLLAGAVVLACGFLALAGLLLGTAAYRLLATPESKPSYELTFEALLSESKTSAATPQAHVTPQASSVATSAAVPSATAEASPGQPGGHIAFTCQIYKYQSSEQICIMNADGSGFRRLTAENETRHYYPSISPDGASVVYSQYREDNVYEIYELSLVDGSTRRLTDKLGALTAPEISPDGESIVFMRWTTASDQDQVWLMDRDGGHPRRLVEGAGWDPTWAPDGTRILFASDRGGSIQLYEVKLNGTGLRRVTSLPAIRGRSDWSSRDMLATYSGEAWKHEIYVMNSDGSNEHQVSPSGGNSQGPSFSPDGQWIAFTAYFDKMNDINGCEIYVMRVDGAELRRLTDNDYCDYQPRWGP